MVARQATQQPPLVTVTALVTSDGDSDETSTVRADTWVAELIGDSPAFVSTEAERLEAGCGASRHRNLRRLSSAPSGQVTKMRSSFLRKLLRQACYLSSLERRSLLQIGARLDRLSVTTEQVVRRIQATLRE